MAKKPSKNAKKNSAKSSGNVSKTHIIIGALAIGLLIAGLSFTDNFGFANILQSKQKGQLFIEPSLAQVKIGESITFTSYLKTATGQAPVNSTWSIENDYDLVKMHLESPDLSPLNQLSTDLIKSFTEKELNRLLNDLLTYMEDETASDKVSKATLGNCKNLPICTVFSGDQAESINLLAQNTDGLKATVKLEIKNEVKTNVFKEEIPSWAEKVVSVLQEKGIMKGYENGNFGVSDPVTLGQTVVLLNKIMNLNSELPVSVAQGTNCNLYTNVPDTHFAHDAICFAHYGNWFNNLNLDTNSLDPDKALKRREVAMLLYNVAARAIFNNVMPNMELAKNVSTNYGALTFTDVAIEDHRIIGTVALLKIMSGVKINDGFINDRVFKPNDQINRVETAVMLWNFMQLLESGVSDIIKNNNQDKFVEEQ